MSAPGNKRKADDSRDDWETPNELFDLINEEFCFSIDGAADKRNFKVSRYYDGVQFEDAFKADPMFERIWLNPPYGQGIDAWIDLALRWRANGNLVVLLLPASTDTAWFHKLAEVATVTRLLSPRVQFVHAPHCVCKACAEGKRGSNTGGSAVVVLAPGLELGVIQPWRWKP